VRPPARRAVFVWIAWLVGVLACLAALTLAVKHPNAGRAECHPSYTPCVPIDADVDCAGGKGNGPSYVVGPVQVIGPDEYGLDADGDGIGCE